MWIATAEHSKQIDKRASCEFGIPAKILMERAGLAVFEAVRSFVPTGKHVAILCGRGNNGGDGFVVGRLARDHGYFAVCVIAAQSVDELTQAAREQYEIAKAQNVCMVFASEEKWAKKLDCLSNFDVIVDALLGTGADRHVEGPIKEAIQAINRSGTPVVAVDLPSGIHCDTGEELGESVWACRTVTMGLPKSCFFQGIGLEHSGFWEVASIGYPQALLDEPTRAKIIERDWIGNLLPERMRNSHKGESGSLVIVAGSRNMPGAASLVAKAALRSGIGLVTVAAIDSVCDAVAAQVPEALLLRLPEQDGGIATEAVDVLLEKQESYKAALFGPGLGQNQSTKNFLGHLWPRWTKCSVIDADALNCVADGVPLPKTDCVMTPHPGEMSRLLKLSIGELQVDRFKTVQMAADRFRQCVLLKGPFTIVGEPGQPLLVNSTGNSGMATGGMGDVLGGVIATLIAQDLPTYYAAACGVHWHGLAGDLCMDEIGPVGYTASDLTRRLPQARVRIVSSCDSKPHCSPS